jgi:hypothetical protein
MPNPLTPHSTNELSYYLAVTACDACGSGPRRLAPGDEAGLAGKKRTATVRCDHCGAEGQVDFVSEFEPVDPASLCISPVDEPSRLVDLNQWLGIAYVLIDDITESRVSDTHAWQIRAAACLTEALKFFDPDDEVPPEEAFFYETSERAFREHPQTFARQHISDMLAKLPPMPAWPGDRA